MLLQRVVFISLVIGVLHLLHSVVYLVTARVYQYEVPYWYVLSFVLAGSLLLIAVGARKYNLRIINALYVVSVTWLGIIFLFFSATALYQIVYFLTGTDSFQILTSFLCTAGIVSLYSIYNASQLHTKEHSLQIKGITAPIRVVHLSDVHIGTVHQDAFLQRVVSTTNALEPDVVLMTGDLFDGSAPINESMLRSLDALSAPCFFSHGNHEEYEGLKEVATTISGLKMQLLDNKVVEWNQLQIIGINDKQSLKGSTLASVLDTLSFDRAKPTILMYHTPVEWETARVYEIDLMLSGHTHNGQIFPFTLLVRLSFKYVSGLFEEVEKYLHVTPGTGTWGPPMRLGSKNQITLLNLLPKQE